MESHPSSSLRIGQRARITPQLSQSIRLLEFSRQELQDEIQAELDTNPALELDDVFLDEQEIENLAIEYGVDPDEPDEFDELTDCQVDLEDMASAIAEDPSHEHQELESLADVDWDELHASSDRLSTTIPNRSQTTDFQISDTTSLSDHLLWQLSVAELTELDLIVASLIVDSLDESGFLLSGFESLTCEAERYGASPDDIQRVLSYVQRLDPTGVATRSAKEFLLIQIEECDWDTNLTSLAVRIVQDHLPAMAKGVIEPIASALRADLSEVLKVRDLIRQLRHTPASGFDPHPTEYIVPDLTVCKNGSNWLVALVDDQSRSIRINPEHESLLQRLPSTSPNYSYLREKLREARSFLNGIEFRNQTILRTATAIVLHQQGFLERGEAAMRPLALTEIAQAISMHESTVSRVAKNKYIRTPRGTLPLRFFFSTRMSQNDGSEVSSTAIRALIKKHTNRENPSSPLSDSKIVDLLRQENIVVARRTVAKYRKSISVPSARLRKRVD